MRPTNNSTNWRVGPVLVIVAALVIALGSYTGFEHSQAPTGREAVAAGPQVLGGPGEDVTVYIRNFRFHPADVRVKQGSRLVFVNEDTVEHNIMHSDGHRVGAGPAAFESPILREGQRWTKVFNDVGEYPIICTVDGHQLMGMVGTIIVE